MKTQTYKVFIKALAKEVKANLSDEAKRRICHALLEKDFNE